MKLKLLSSALLLSAMLAAPVSANDSEPAIRALIDSDIKAWASSSEVVSAINAQNAKNAGLDQAAIDSLDKKWRAETKADSKPMIDGVLANSLSVYLKGVKENGAGKYSEIFVMDNKGLNVGQSDVTSDYWQGDEGKWKKTYLVGPDAIMIGEVEFDDSSQTYQSQVNLSVVDPASNKVIGAVTIGVNVENLE
jgi:glycerol-3-phosphate dehydrogenase